MVNPLIIGVITHLLSGMSHQVAMCILDIPVKNPITHMQPMVLVYKNLHDWVILDTGSHVGVHSFQHHGSHMPHMGYGMGDITNTLWLCQNSY